LTALLFAAAASAAETAPPASIALDESAQSAAGAAAQRAAADFDLLAEEAEINFGADNASRFEAAGAEMSEVAREDVPAVLDALSNLRTAGAAEAPAEARRVVALQDAILARLQGISGLGAGSLALESLKAKSDALITAQRADIDSTKRLATETGGAAPETLSPAQRAALDGLKDAQAKAARDIAQLSKSASEVPAPRAGQPAAAESVPTQGLADAADDAAQASRSAGEGNLQQALAQEQSALDRLQSFRNSLEGSAQPAKPGEELASLQKEQDRLAGETASASRGELSSLASRQNDLEKKSERLQSSLSANPLARSYAAAASGEMRNAAESLMQSRAQVSQDRADAAKAQAAASQRKSSEYLAAAQKALDNPEAAQLENRMLDAMKDLDAEEGRLQKLDDLIAKEEDLKERTSARSGRNSSKRLANEQEKLKSDLARASQPSRQSPSQEARSKSASPSRQSSSQAGSPSGKSQSSSPSGKPASQPGSSPPTGASPSPSQEEKTAEAATAMQAAARALTRGNLARASDSQEQAVAAMRSAHDAQAKRAASAFESLSQLADSASSSSIPRPLPPMVESLLSRASARLAGNGSKGGAPQPGAQPSTASLPAEAQSAGIRGFSTSAAGAVGIAPSGPAWQTVLPPGTPADILQSASGAFPRGYEEAVRRYYEAIASK
jgi:hypothetical protein